MRGGGGGEVELHSFPATALDRGHTTVALRTGKEHQSLPPPPAKPGVDLKNFEAKKKKGSVASLGCEAHNVADYADCVKLQCSGAVTVL
jgi:hypothetical protein